MKKESLYIKDSLKLGTGCSEIYPRLTSTSNHVVKDNPELLKSGETESGYNVGIVDISGRSNMQAAADTRNSQLSQRKIPVNELCHREKLRSKEPIRQFTSIENNESDPKPTSETESISAFRSDSAMTRESSDHDDSNSDFMLSGEDPLENSPFSIVRASVSAIDDTSLSVNTPRMWCLSLMFAILGSSANLIFSLRYPSVYVTPVIALLLAHPIGLLWDKILKYRDDPHEEFKNGAKVHGEVNEIGWRRFRLWLGQGRWNEKEHSCVYISSNVSFGFAFATDVIVEQTKFYNQEAGIIYQLLLTLSSQILGYTFAGMTRRFLVRPARMIWPATLMSVAMFSSMHKNENKTANGWKITKLRFFITVWACSFAFYFLPGLLFPALSYFNVITWIWPKSVIVANLFGVVSGLGLFPVTFDWAQIAYIGSPLLTPFWAAMNVVGGLVIVMWIIAPIAYYKNIFNSSYMPILSSSVFDNTGHIYNVSKILTPDFTFDRKAYENYSRVYLPITYVLSYGVQFAALASLLTHTICWHGRDIWRQLTRSISELKGYEHVMYQSLRNSENFARPEVTDEMGSNMQSSIFDEDVHYRLMSRYNDAPMSWYLLVLILMTCVGIFVCEYYPVYLPWYGFILALGICGILFVPIGIVMAITNQQPSIYLICQLICGSLFPGRPVANMIFVTYGYISSAQGLKFCTDLKLGHYMKVPPRTLFYVQMVATIVSSITQIFVLNWVFANAPKICTPDAPNGFTCPIAKVHFNGSILWGVVGPMEFFGSDATYRSLILCFPIGAIAPVILWLYARNRKASIVRKINLPILFGSLSWIPPATGLNFSVWALVCYLFNSLIKRRANKWWAKYTMTLSAALDSGLAFGLVTVFFGFVLPGFVENWSWWGTEIFKKGCDWAACSYRTVLPGEHFDSYLKT